MQQHMHGSLFRVAERPLGRQDFKSKFARDSLNSHRDVDPKDAAPAVLQLRYIRLMTSDSASNLPLRETAASPSQPFMRSRRRVRGGTVHASVMTVVLFAVKPRGFR